MTEDLHRLVYHSKNLVPGTPEDLAGTIEAILAASQQNNAAVNVTGALMFNSGCFAQVLEGARSAVETTFERIQRDERHSDVMVLDFGPVGARGFPSWSMAFVGRSLAGQDLFSHVAARSGFDEKRLEGERLYDLLRELVLEEEQALV